VFGLCERDWESCARIANEFNDDPTPSHFMKKTLVILEPRLSHFLENPFVTLNAMEGTIYRLQPGRKTIAFTFNEQTYFAKIHSGVGWKEIIKNLLQLRLPIISAKTEWNALLALQKIGIMAPIPVAFGEKGVDPARMQSFILTKALPASINLEEYFKSTAISFTQKKNIILRVAQITKSLHEHGINHRDLYLCHFLLDQTAAHSSKPLIYLIDLHRAQIRSKVPFRWRVKDISGLYFSTLDLNFTQRDYLRFMLFYTGKSLRTLLNQEHFFWKTVSTKAKRLHLKLLFKEVPYPHPRFLAKFSK
jgi:tRNA A-37 threonylcarbamoyl transferase component Bud32